MLKSILIELNGSSVDIQASAIISSDGLVIASLLSSDMDEDRVGAMAATMLSLGDRTSQELGRGKLEQVLVKGDKGYVLMIYVEENIVLNVITTSSAKLGLIFLDIKHAVESINKVI